MAAATPRPLSGDDPPRNAFTTQPEWISAARLANLLDVRVDHLRSLVARREIPFGRVGRLVRFHWPTIQRWIGEAAAAGRAPARVSP